MSRWCAPVAMAVAAALVSGAPVRAGEAELPDVSARPPAELLAPSRLALQEQWREGLAHERREDFAAANACFERLAGALPESSHVRWRIARNHWRAGERLPVEAKRERMEAFRLAERWADAALAIDPECGECVLWKLAALGRQATTGGVVQAAGTASEIADLIDRGLALRPTHADGRSNVTLANLYYAGAAFYRVVPDWFWLEWVIGVRGDRQRALAYIRRALELSDLRIDYQVELGAVLTCIGHEDRDAARLAEGRAALQRALELEPLQSTDQLDVEHARVLLADPSRACTYSRDGWIDLGEGRAAGANPGRPR